jgi:hypothetical protein
MKKVYDAVVSTGKYTDRQSGKEKNRYLTVGAVFVNDKGQYSLKLEALPVGPDFSGWINFYEPKPRGEQKPQEKPAEASQEEFLDDSTIPF